MVRRMVEDFEVVEAANFNREISVSINDPDGYGHATTFLTIDEAKLFVKEIRQAIKESEGK